MTSIAASHDEQQRAMAGDGIVPDPWFAVTHAITIEEPPQYVWPWLAQMGSLRGGWYSYDRIDNGGRPSADRVFAAFQQIAPGDILPALPGATDAFVVAAVEPPRDVILTVPAERGEITSWEHFVEPLGPRGHGSSSAAGSNGDGRTWRVRRTPPVSRQCSSNTCIG